MTRAARAASEPSPASAAAPGASPGAAPPPLSVMHRHLLDVVLSRHDFGRGPVRLLDAGCGDGLLLAWLARSLAHLFPRAEIELYGFDVGNHGVQPPEYFQRTVETLQSRAPGQRWDDRLALISDRDPWPWPAGMFDVVVSNQVLEHVRDHRLFFSELRRALAPGGFSVHVFPTRHCLVEPHLKIPFAHRMGDRDRTARYIEFATRLGFGRYDARVETRRSFAVRHADYLAENVNYLSVPEIRQLAAQSGLHATFRHTPGLYAAKLRSLLGQTGATRLRTRGRDPAAGAATFPFRLLSCVTLVLSRDELPIPPARAAE